MGLITELNTAAQHVRIDNLSDAASQVLLMPLLAHHLRISSSRGVHRSCGYTIR